MTPLSLIANSPYWKQAKVTALCILAILLFSAGWLGHAKWAKPVTVTIQVPVKVENPEQPERKVGDTVEPAHHTVSNTDMPVAPNDPLPTTQATTVIEVPVLVPQLVKVFHQNSLKFSEQDSGYSVWVDGRVWATDESGKTIAGVHAQTLFNRDAEMFIPKTIKVPPVHPWAIGGRYVVTGIDKGTFGLTVDRDVAFLRLGVEANYHKTNLGNLQHTELQTVLRTAVVF